MCSSCLSAQGLAAELQQTQFAVPGVARVKAQELTLLWFPFPDRHRPGLGPCCSWP